MKTPYMKTSLNTLAIRLLGTFIIFCGQVPHTFAFDQPAKTVQDASARIKAIVPKTIAKKTSVRADESLPFSERSLKGERSFHSIIQKTALRYNIDPALIKAIIMVESQYDPNAISGKGAMGLMQLMPVTARSLGVDDIFNPEQNIHAGVRHFKFLLKQFDGDIKLALAAYNAGSRPVRRYKDIPPFKATKRYLMKVFRYWEFYRNGKR
jgi:soluble lytic murein transglycosylase-like protein